MSLSLFAQVLVSKIGSDPAWNLQSSLAEHKQQDLDAVINSSASPSFVTSCTKKLHASNLQLTSSKFSVLPSRPGKVTVVWMHPDPTCHRTKPMPNGKTIIAKDGLIKKEERCMPIYEMDWTYDVLLSQIPHSSEVVTAFDTFPVIDNALYIFHPYWPTRGPR